MIQHSFRIPLKFIWDSFRIRLRFLGSKSLRSCPRCECQIISAEVCDWNSFAKCIWLFQTFRNLGTGTIRWTQKLLSISKVYNSPNATDKWTQGVAFVCLKDLQDSKLCKVVNFELQSLERINWVFPEVHSRRLTHQINDTARNCSTWSHRKTSSKYSHRFAVSLRCKRTKRTPSSLRLFLSAPEALLRSFSHSTLFFVINFGNNFHSIWRSSNFVCRRSSFTDRSHGVWPQHMPHNWTHTDLLWSCARLS